LDHRTPAPTVEPFPKDNAHIVNVANRLDEMARLMPQAVAIAEPTRRIVADRRVYRTVTFRQLVDDVHTISNGLVALGARPGMRLALLVPPSIDFIALVFALLKSGAVQILIDPGMGKRNLLRCLADARPEGFVAISAVQAIRSVLSRGFPPAKLNITVGRKLWWNGPTLDEIRNTPTRADLLTAVTTAHDEAAVIFTSGGTGPPKGVLYRHGNFDCQVAEIQAMYDIKPGEIDLPCFALFGLFNAAMGVTTVLPRMNFSRPATVDPRNIADAVEQWNATQSFASPAVWDRVAPYCEQHGLRLKSLRRVMSAGAPVPARVLRSMKAVIHPEGEVHTPYGATEALPVATIGSTEVLNDTWPLTEQGQGVCVGRRIPGIEWRVIRIVEGPIHSIAQTEQLPPGEIGELIVRGPVVTTEYVTRREANALAKITDDSARTGSCPRQWHRMGDCGYFDEQNRFWFCGRVVHRVLTKSGPMYPIPCEAIFNQHPAVFRSALVGIGPQGDQTPVIIVEPKRDWRSQGGQSRTRLISELRALGQANRLTAAIELFLIHPSLPVDVRHNAKIFREKLAIWATRRLRGHNRDDSHNKDLA
jgi:acyl-CoA synthetase (AMP-forming)/AMP-acid ligase II